MPPAWWRPSRGAPARPPRIRLVAAAAERVAEERAKAGGTKSRRTMEVMATTISDVSDLMKSQTRKRWVKIVGIVAGVALVIIGIQGA